MRVPIEWLKEFIKVDIAPERLADRLTMSGLEVGAIEYHGNKMSDIVVGKIKSIERHATKPDILICQVDTGIKILQIVTKAGNLKLGDKVPVALHGATLPSGIKVQKRELHGVESFGMLCSEIELGLSDKAEGIMILDKVTAVGEDIRKVLGIGGAVLDIDVLPNRIDVLSVFGVARELGAILSRKVYYPAVRVKETSEPAAKHLKISIKDPDLCPRYTARVVKGIKIKDSPQWMQDRLLACGMRPINNVVDATNYVLLETGQPLHAFDLGGLKGHEIAVRRAKQGEKIKTLDGETRELHGALVIADAERPVAIAGVMGGSNTEVSSSTTDIVIESAYFDPKTIHKAEKSLKIRTEASTRFDRGVDWTTVPLALERAAGLIAEISGGRVLKGMVDVKRSDRKARQIAFRSSKVNDVLGSAIKPAEISAILKRLGFVQKGGKLSIPLYRAGDIEREIDVIEEIARIYGYDRIPSTLPDLGSERIKRTTGKNLKRIREMLIDLGFIETVNYSMLSEKSPVIGEQKGEAVRLLNPISEDLSVMRRSLIPSLLKVLTHNLNRQMDDVNIFEIDKVFYKDKKGEINEDLQLGLLLYGKRMYRYDGIKESPDFFQCKMIIKDVLDHLGVEHELVQSALPGLHPGRSAVIARAGKSIGYFGEVHPVIAESAGATAPLYVISVDMGSLLEIRKASHTFSGIPQFPAVRRDIAMIVPGSVTHSSIVKEIKSIGGSLIEEIRLFDKYEGGSIEAGYVSLAYSITFRDPARTLTDEEVNKKHAEISDSLTKKLGVKIRK